jgi:hypothetical protein
MKTAIVAVVAGLFLTGCASSRELPHVMALKKPATPTAKVKATHHHPVVTGYVHRKPTAPVPWVKGKAPTPGLEVVPLPETEGEQQK